GGGPSAGAWGPGRRAGAGEGGGGASIVGAGRGAGGSTLLGAGFAAGLTGGVTATSRSSSGASGAAGSGSMTDGAGARLSSPVATSVLAFFFFLRRIRPPVADSP